MGKKIKEADYQKQFEAAVRVIQGLPKNGAYRPSYEEMLRFYSYYKQATVGPCQIPRPGFWDPIGRYKWDAWNRLGRMTKEEAMVAYIAEMKKAAQKVINTIPLDETSEDMFAYFEPLYEVIHDMPRPPESFFKKKAGPGHMDKAIEINQATNDSENEVFCESLAQVEPNEAKRLSAKPSLPLNDPHKVQGHEKKEHKPPMHEPISSWDGKPNKDPYDLSPPAHFTNLPTSPHEKVLGSSPEVISQTGALIHQEVDLQVTSTIQALQQDMKKVMERLSSLESWAVLQNAETCFARILDFELLIRFSAALTIASGSIVPKHFKHSGHTAVLNPGLARVSEDKEEPPNWPVHLSPRTWLFLLTWPFVVQWLLWSFQRQKR